MSTASSEKIPPKVKPAVARKETKAAASAPVKRSNDFGSPLRVLLSTLIIFVASQVLAAIIAGFLLSITGASTSFDSSNSAQFIYILLAEGAAAGAVFMILRNRKLPLSSIGLGRRPQWSDLGKAAIGFVAFYALLVIASIVVTYLDPSINNGKQDVGFNNITTFSDNILAFLALVIIPPLGEETLVRGYLYSGLRSRWRYIPAMLVTSGLFAAAHLFTGDSGLLWSAAVDTFILSIVLVYLREHTGALYAGMLVHAANNLIAFGVHFH